jgi:GT2 family glycosyltransferase
MSARLNKASLSVAIVSKGRPQILAETVESISRQTLEPQQIVIVVPSAADLPENTWGDDVQTLFGTLGLTIQRNRAIAAVPLTVDYIAFFDDDFELSPDYLECAIAFMEANAGIVGFSGRLLANGGVNREQARKLIADFKPQRHHRGMFFSEGKDHILHGCNMVIRRAVLEYEIFDEDLPLYSYAEDYDLSMRLMRYGLIGKFEGCIGVHLETPSGRVHEKQRGYSLVANNFHFLKKRTVHLPLPLAWIRFWAICVGKPLLNCFWKILKRDKSKDWTGQSKGILLAVSDIFLGRCQPDRVKEIST